MPETQADAGNPVPLPRQVQGDFPDAAITVVDEILVGILAFG
jgi:hypothetical protein